MRAMPYSTIAGAALRAGLIIPALPTLAQACAVCVGSSPADTGYFWGVLFLMAMPFALGGLISGWLWYHCRRGPARPPSAAPTAAGDGPRGRAVTVAPTPAALPNDA